MKILAAPITPAERRDALVFAEQMMRKKCDALRKQADDARRSAAAYQSADFKRAAAFFDRDAAAIEKHISALLDVLREIDLDAYAARVAQAEAA